MNCQHDSIRRFVPQSRAEWTFDVHFRSAPMCLKHFFFSGEKVMAGLTPIHPQGIAILDCRGPVSVTNDIENVLADLRRCANVYYNVQLDHLAVVYCDSERRWDGIETSDNAFADFVLLNAGSATLAIAAMLKKKGVG